MTGAQLANPANPAKPMNLQDLFDGTGIAAPDLMVSDIGNNTASLTRGSLFLACQGRRSHGLDYLPAALESGVAAVAWEPVEGRVPPVLPAGVAAFPVAKLSQRLGQLADRFFASPSAALSVTAITGTNGKTTTAFLLAQALNGAGKTAAYLGTLGWGLPDALQPGQLTTPDSVELQRQLAAIRDLGASHVVLEASSHGLDQGRLNGLRIAVAALTNLSRDHLDYHGDLEAYAEAKARLFFDCAPGAAVINIGDSWGSQLATRLAGKLPVVSVALLSNDATQSGANLLGRLTATERRGLGLSFSGDFGESELSSPLWGEFNAENLLVATGSLLALGLKLDEATAALSSCVAPPGRLQRLHGNGRHAEAIVDFAHTPEALQQALSAVRQHTRGQLWCVFGCGGDRDAGKRAAMGEVAASLADQVVLTDDNPRSEDPEAIAADVLAGMPDAERVARIADRSAAIQFALKTAANDDAVLIAGKGHETQQWLADGAVDFSDVAVARAALSGAP